MRLAGCPQQRQTGKTDAQDTDKNAASRASSLAVTLTSTSLLAAEKTLKFHSGYAESRPEAGYVDDFAALVSEKSGGELVVDVYHAGSLGLKEPDMLRTLQRGMVDMALLYGEYYTRDAPELSAVCAQGAIKEAEEHLEVLPTLREIYAREYGKWGIKIIGVVAPVFDVGVHCKKPANSLDEFEERKLRVWSAHLVDTFTRLGISAQVIPQNDMYMALQTGVVDCAYYLSTVAETVSLNEVTDYEAYLHPWAAAPAVFGVLPLLADHPGGRAGLYAVPLAGDLVAFLLLSKSLHGGLAARPEPLLAFGAGFLLLYVINIFFNQCVA